MFMTEELLGLWLGQIPAFSVVFVQLVLLNTQIRALHPSIDTLFKAVGNIKYYQIVENVILLMPIAASFIALKYGAPYYSVFLFVILFNVIAFAAVLVLARRIADLNIKDYFFSVLSPCTCALVLIGLFFKLMQLCAFTAFYLKALYTAGSLLFILFFIYLSGLNSQEKTILHSILKRQ